MTANYLLLPPAAFMWSLLSHMTMNIIVLCYSDHMVVGCIPNGWLQYYTKQEPQQQQQQQLFFTFQTDILTKLI